VVVDADHDEIFRVHGAPPDDIRTTLAVSNLNCDINLVNISSGL
jgi:hypothetical protein